MTGNGLEALGRVCGAGEKPYWYDRVLAGSSLFVSGPALRENNASASASLQGPLCFLPALHQEVGGAEPSSLRSPQCSVILNAFFFFLSQNHKLSPDKNVHSYF